jgi:16S rRNA processing protein RimM
MLILGRIVGAHGIQGAVRVRAFGDDPAGWKKIRAWHLSLDDTAADSAWRTMQPVAFSQRAEGLIVRFEGIADRDAAEALKGFYVGALREDMPETAPDEFYWDDLVGLEVANTQGEALGAVAGLIETGANDVLRVVAGEGEAAVERLIPFARPIVESVSLEDRRIVVDWDQSW